MAGVAGVGQAALGELDGQGGRLLERDVAVNAVGGALRAAAGGTGTALFVAGSPGIGKTSIVELAKRAARESGFTLASAVGSPMETGLAFGLVGQATIALRGGGTDDVGELQGLELEGQPARLYRIFRRLSDVAAQAPLLLALDDLQWADPDSLELLGFVARRLTSCRILVLGSLRPEPDAASLLAHDLVASGHARVVTLDPLSPEAAADLVGDIVGHRLRAREARQVWRATAGTPLLLKAAASVLSDEGALPAGDGAGTFGSPLLLKRFAGVGDDAFAYVQAASILGVRFRPDLAGPLAELEERTWEDVHARLLRAGLLLDLGAGWASFVHPLFAQALLETRPPSARERCHAKAFELLVARGAPDAITASHAAAARLLGDARAIEVATRAGRTALAQGGVKAAAEHLANAIDLAGEAADDHLLLDHATALVACMRLDEGRQVCARLLARGGQAAGLRAQALALEARAALLTASPQQAERLYEEAADAAAGVDPDAEGAMLADASVTCLIASPVSWVVPTASRALAALRTGTPTHRHIECLKAYASLLGGDPSGAELIRSELRRWRRDSRWEEHGWAWTFAVHALNALKILEDLQGATEHFEREFERAVGAGAPILVNALAVAYADVVHRLGRPEEALALVERAAALSDRPMSPWTDLARAVLLSELGRDEEANASIEVLRMFRSKVAPQYCASVSLWLDLLGARRLLAAGDPDEASETMVRAAHVAELSGWREPCIVPWAGVALEAHCAAGRADLAAELLDTLEALVQPLACRWPRAVLALGRARLAMMERPRGEADRLFAVALGMFAELPMPLARAEALVAFGSHLRHSGRPRQAREPLGQALGIAERSGSGRVARLASAELEASGGRRRRRTDDASRLTPQEARAAALAAEGMTNVQIAAAMSLSAKTVGHHLQHVYRKLGIGSRRDLIRQGASPASPRN